MKSIEIDRSKRLRDEPQRGITGFIPTSHRSWRLTRGKKWSWRHGTLLMASSAPRPLKLTSAAWTLGRCTRSRGRFL